MAQREWKEIRKFEEILFEEYNGIAKITINRPRYRNAFTPKTTLELSQAFAQCRELQRIRVVLLTGAMSEVPEGKTLGDVKHAFCSGGDMHVKGRGGYIDDEGVPRLSVLDVQMQIRRLPKPVIAMVNGYAIGGGHVLPNVAATASVTHPVKQGLIQALGVFTDTLLVCSCTSFIILISGLYQTPGLNGIALTQSALQSEVGSIGPMFIAVGPGTSGFRAGGGR